MYTTPLALFNAITELYYRRWRKAAKCSTTPSRQNRFVSGDNRGGAFSHLTTKRFTACPEPVEGANTMKTACRGARGCYYNARWYDPQVGRFLSADTIVPGPANPQAFTR